MFLQIYKKYGALLFLCLVALCGCGYVGKPKNLSIAHKEVAVYYTSGRFAEEVGRLVEHTKRHFVQKARSKKDVVIFDVDFTVLDYFEQTKSIQFGFYQPLFHEWIITADAPPMPHMLSLYTHFRELGYAIIFITERQPKDFEATERNLQRAGFVGYDRLIIRSPELCSMPSVTYKACIRRQLHEEGYEVIASVSDQSQDFIGGNVGFPVKVPNYLFALEHLQDAPS